MQNLFNLSRLNTLLVLGPNTDLFDQYKDDNCTINYYPQPAATLERTVEVEKDANPDAHSDCSLTGIIWEAKSGGMTMEASVAQSNSGV